MVKWTSGGSERTFNQSAASGRKDVGFSDALRAVCLTRGIAGVGEALRREIAGLVLRRSVRSMGI